MLPDCSQPDVRSNVDDSRPHDVIHCEGKVWRKYEQELIGEEPLLIRVEGQPYSVVMRTPGGEIFHAAGFCLSEGLVDGPEDFATIGYCGQDNTNVATVTLSPARRKKVASLLKRRGFISQTSCGICGKEVVKDLRQILSPTADETRISVSQAVGCVSELSHVQRLHKRTRSAHAVMLFDSEFHLLAVAEDVGRHNALDKAIGEALMNEKLATARLAILSSRMSYEMVQKGARARLPILVSVSRPTTLAVELGRSLHMTLACLSRENGLFVFCGNERIVEG